MAKRELSGRSRLYPTHGPSGLPDDRTPAAVPWLRVVAVTAVVAFSAGAWTARRTASVRGAYVPAAEDLAATEGAAIPGAELEAEREPAVEVAAAINAAPELPVKIEPRVLRRSETLYDALLEQGFRPEEVWALVKAAQPFANLSKLRSGTKFTVWKRTDLFGDDRVVSLQMPIALNKTLLLRPAGGAFEAAVDEVPYETRLTAYTGTVESTLWEAAVTAGMDPNMIAELADVFAFSVDFNTEVRKGDRWRLLVEQKTLEGRPAGYGRILAAEYVNGRESHTAIHFENAQGDAEYFAADGRSLRRMFLRSPLRYTRISSRFGTRLHPVHKTRKEHQGVDYAASTGTPVRTVGDGVVTASGWNGGSGNFVKVRHNSTYETSYSHLSGYGPGIRKGARVRQGQVIGYVGSTGLSTGPHLHFAFYEKGRYVDPLSRRFPAADPVPTAEKVRFEKTKAELLPLLPRWPADTGAQSASATKSIPAPPALAAPIAATGR